MEKKKYKIDCENCGGTGVYSGMAEKDNCAVICYSCEGQGWVWHTVPAEFVERKIRKGLKRIFKSSCGYGHTADDVTTEDKRLIKFSEAGCTYKEFLAGKRPKPVKELYCPYLWSNQGMQQSSHKAHKMYKSKCQHKISMGGYISKCVLFSKALTECWPEYEKIAKDWDD